jgi:trimethylamine--corrinoid protein Co-methyltransferase
VVAEFRRRRDLIVQGLNAIPGVRCPMPQGTFYVFPNIHFVMSIGLPADVDPALTCDVQMALMLEHTAKPLVFVSNEFSGCVDAVEMAEAVAGGTEAFKLRPFAACYINVTTGLRHNEDALQKLLFLAEKGLPALYIPMVISGISGPNTPAGTVALVNTGVLVGLVLSQL